MAMLNNQMVIIEVPNFDPYPSGGLMGFLFADFIRDKTMISMVCNWFNDV